MNADVSEHDRSGPRAAAWRRRAVTFPALALLATLYFCTLPLLLAAAAVGDLVRGGRWPLVRAVVYAGVGVLCEVGGVLAAGLLFIAAVVTRVPTARFLRWNVALQTRWATTLYRAAERVFDVRTEVEGDACLARGPFLLFIRHVSHADAFLPVVCAGARYGIALRYVLKRELLWDPCLDVVGHRLPNAFISRGAGQGAREIARIQGLLTGLDEDAGVLIYPEGTRFSPAKQARALARLEAEARPDLLERACRFRHVLPPHLGGPLGLLDAHDRIDVVFCAHTGLEAAGSIGALLAGGLVGTTVKVAFWRVPFREIPRGREARARWLYDEWQRVDDWIAALGAPRPALRSVG